jgi:ubiquinone biosynthesis protein
MRTAFLMESTVRTLDLEFNLMDGLLAKAPAFAGEAMSEGGNDSGTQRLKYEAAVAFRQIPDGLSSLVRKARAGKLGIRLNHHGLENLERQIERASRRVALSLVTLGLYIAASLLMQHSIGPRIFDFPLLAALGYGLALWLTFHLVKGARNIEES